MSHNAIGPTGFDPNVVPEYNLKYLVLSCIDVIVIVALFEVLNDFNEFNL